MPCTGRVIEFLMSDYYTTQLLNQYYNYTIVITQKQTTRHPITIYYTLKQSFQRDNKFQNWRQ